MHENKGNGWWPPLSPSVFKTNPDGKNPYGLKGTKKVTQETRRYASQAFKQTASYRVMMTPEK